MERSFSGNEIVELFRKQCSPTVFGFCNKWFRDVELVGYMNTWLPGLSVLEMNRAFRREKSIAMCFDDVEKPNKYGFYRYRDTIKRERFTFYYISKDTTTLPVMLDDHQEWLEAAAENVIRRSGRAKPTKRRNEESPGLREGTLNTSKQARNTSTPPAIKSTATQQHGQPPQIGDSPTEMQTSPPHDNTNQVLVGAIQHPELATDEIGHDHPQSLPIGFSVFESEMIQGLSQQMESAYFDEPRNRRLFAGKCDSPGSSKRNLERWIETLERAISNVEALPNVESIYKQFSFSSKAWYTKDGATKMLPKDDGHGMMISTFVSRSWGFLMNGNPLLAASLFRIDELRLHATNNKYVSTEAAVNLNGHTAKTPITNAQPFTRFFEYGADKEGYWNYEYMALQLEDIVDCLVVMFPAHDFVFLFDQSSGHGKQQSDGLNALNMNNDWGGAVPSMRDTQIIDQACLGPYNHDDKLQVGDVQHLVYQENDRGPVAKKGHRLNDAQRVASKNTHRTGRKTKRNTQAHIYTPVPCGLVGYDSRELDWCGFSMVDRDTPKR